MLHNFLNISRMRQHPQKHPNKAVNPQANQVIIPAVALISVLISFSQNWHFTLAVIVPYVYSFPGLKATDFRLTDSFCVVTGFIMRPSLQKLFDIGCALIKYSDYILSEIIANLDLLMRGFYFMNNLRVQLHALNLSNDKLFSSPTDLYFTSFVYFLGYRFQVRSWFVNKTRLIDEELCRML